jgi:hypothetical protein
MSAQPIYGNQTFNNRNMASAQIQRLKADEVNSSSYIAGIAPTAPTGPTGPLNNIPQVGQIVYAATGPLGGTGQSGIYIYTGLGTGWQHVYTTY